MSLQPKGSFVEVSKLIQPRLVEFGALLFGKNLEWSIEAPAPMVISLLAASVRSCGTLREGA
jgi:hypothetical protein